MRSSPYQATRNPEWSAEQGNSTNEVSQHSKFFSMCHRFRAFGLNAYIWTAKSSFGNFFCLAEYNSCIFASAKSLSIESWDLVTLISSWIETRISWETELSFQNIEAIFNCKSFNTSIRKPQSSYSCLPYYFIYMRAVFNFDKKTVSLQVEILKYSWFSSSILSWNFCNWHFQGVLHFPIKGSDEKEFTQAKQIESLNMKAYLVNHKFWFFGTNVFFHNDQTILFQTLLTPVK